MDCWNILGVDRTADKKTIKVAYAKLLKVTRPDDDPEGFARLHSAYQSALTMCSSSAPSKSQGSTATTVIDGDEVIPGDQSSSSADSSSTSTVSNERQAELVSRLSQLALLKAPSQEVFEDSEKEPIVERLQAPQGTGQQQSEADDPQQTEHRTAEYPDYRQELHRDQLLLESKVQEIIESPDTVSKIAQWEFLETLPSMVDLNFRSQASNLIFDVVSTANQQSLTTGVLDVSRPVLIYLNDFFQWENNWQVFVNAHGENRCNAVLLYLHNNNAKNLNVSMYYSPRITAFAVDATLCGVCALLAYELPAFAFLNYVAMFYALVAIPLMESSAWQGSIGKRALNLTVVGADGLRIGWHDSFFRSYVTYFCIAWFKLSIWINIFTNYKYGAMLQDWITKSYVVKGS